MRLGFVTDIHGNLHALRAALDVLHDVDEVICLGDIVDLGPEPGPVIDLLRERGIRCVRGNHDTIDEYPELPFLDDIERWTERVLDDDRRAWLAGLPEALRIEANGHRLLAVHASPRALTEGLYAETPEETLRAWCVEPFDVLVCGHTHVQTIRRLDGRYFVNVGSTSTPFAKLPTAGKPPVVLPWAECGVITLGERIAIELREVAFDLDAFFAAVDASGMPHAKSFKRQWRR
jgi:putative phosphoesterase